METWITVVISVVTFLTGIAGTIYVIGMKRGSNQTTLSDLGDKVDQVEETVDKIDTRLGVVENAFNLQQQSIQNIQRDHERLVEAVEKLEGNVNTNNQLMAGVKASMEGLQGFLKMVVEGHVKITPK